MARAGPKGYSRGKKPPNVTLWLAVVLGLLLANVTLFAARWSRMTIDWSARRLHTALLTKNNNEIIRSCSDLLGRMSSSDPRRAVPLLIRAHARLQKRDYKRGRTDLKAANGVLSRHGRSAPKWWVNRCRAIAELLLGVCAVNPNPTQANTAVALKAFGRAEELDPNLSDAWIAKGTAYIWQENWTEAEKQFERAFDNAQKRKPLRRGSNESVSLAPSPRGVVHLYNGWGSVKASDRNRARERFEARRAFKSARAMALFFGETFAKVVPGPNELAVTVTVLGKPPSELDQAERLEVLKEIERMTDAQFKEYFGENVYLARVALALAQWYTARNGQTRHARAAMQNVDTARSTAPQRVEALLDKATMHLYRARGVPSGYATGQRVWQETADLHNDEIRHGRLAPLPQSRLWMGLSPAESRLRDRAFRSRLEGKRMDIFKNLRARDIQQIEKDYTAVEKLYSRAIALAEDPTNPYSIPNPNDPEQTPINLQYVTPVKKLRIYHIIADGYLWQALGRHDPNYEWRILREHRFDHLNLERVQPRRGTVREKQLKERMDREDLALAAYRKILNHRDLRPSDPEHNLHVALAARNVGLIFYGRERWKMALRMFERSIEAYGRYERSAAWAACPLARKTELKRQRTALQQLKYTITQPTRTAPFLPRGNPGRLPGERRPDPPRVYAHSGSCLIGGAVQTMAGPLQVAPEQISMTIDGAPVSTQIYGTQILHRANNLRPGRHRVVFTATDPYGNSNADSPQRLVVVVDGTSPVISAVMPQGATTDRFPHIKISYDDPDSGINPYSVMLTMHSTSLPGSARFRKALVMDGHYMISSPGTGPRFQKGEMVGTKGMELTTDIALPSGNSFQLTLAGSNNCGLTAEKTGDFNVKAR